jgi:hypothetical protein
VALVPKGPSDITPCSRGLSWWERRQIEATIREIDLHEDLRGRHARRCMRNANQLMRETAAMDEGFDEELQARLDRNRSPRLEDTTDERWEQWRKISGRIIDETYGGASRDG